MIRDDIEATGLEWEQARKKNDRMAPMYAVLALVAVSALAIPASLIASLMASGFAQVLLSALVLAALFSPILVAILYSGRKVGSHSEHVMTTLERQLKETVRRSAQERRLANALEMAEGEPEVLEVVERAFAATLPTSPVELLLADNSHAHLSRMATASPTGEPPNCRVDSPDRCPAARRAQVQRFDDSERARRVPEAPLAHTGVLRRGVRSGGDHGPHGRCHPRDA